MKLILKNISLTIKKKKFFYFLKKVEIEKAHLNEFNEFN